MKDLSSGTKKAIFCDDVKVLFVPHYENLSLNDILDFGMAELQVVGSLPIYRETRKMPRQYVINCIYTIVGTPFSNWVDIRV
jgi:hypothetical protein